MEKTTPAASPDAYVAALQGWRRELVASIRKAARSAAPMDEEIKWGHIVYMSSGPMAYIRAEEHRVLLGFWRGKRLVELEPRLKPSGGYELATIELREGDAIGAAPVKRLIKEAAALNARLGDPRDAAKTGAKKKAAKRATGKKAKKQATARKAKKKPPRG